MIAEPPQDLQQVFAAHVVGLQQRGHVVQAHDHANPGFTKCLEERRRRSHGTAAHNRQSGGTLSAPLVQRLQHQLQAVHRQQCLTGRDQAERRGDDGCGLWCTEEGVAHRLRDVGAGVAGRERVGSEGSHGLCATRGHRGVIHGSCSHTGDGQEAHVPAPQLWVLEVDVLPLDRGDELRVEVHGGAGRLVCGEAHKHQARGGARGQVHRQDVRCPAATRRSRRASHTARRGCAIAGARGGPGG